MDDRPDLFLPRTQCRPYLADIFDPDIAVEAGGHFRELLRCRETLVRLAAFMRAEHDDARADAVHPCDQPVGPAPKGPLIVDRDRDHAVPAAFGDDTCPAIGDIIFGAGFRAV